MASYPLSDSGLDSSPISMVDGSFSTGSLEINVPSSSQMKPLHSNFGRSTTILKVDKDDERAKRHFIKTEYKDGKEYRIWECGICSKEFKYQYTLIRHIPTHTDVRNFHCDVCTKSFRQMSTLAQHKATHWNVRPFTCNICLKAFNRVSTLISHKKIHSDDKKHVCGYCGKGFHQKGNLKNHIYTHTNERPYKCDLCSKGFNQKSNLVVHKNSTHLKKKNEICFECNIKFEKPYLYSHHMETVHCVKVGSSPMSSSSSADEFGSISSGNFPSPPVDIVDIKEERKEVSVKTEDQQKHASPKQQQLNTDHILAYIKKNPTHEMMKILDKNELPFVLYFKAGQIVPAICKVVICGKYYSLVNPNWRDLEKYYSGTNSYPEIPIVSIIRENVVNGEIEIIVNPFVKSQIEVQPVSNGEGTDKKIKEETSSPKSVYNTTEAENSLTQKLKKRMLADNNLCDLPSFSKERFEKQADINLHSRHEQIIKNEDDEYFWFLEDDNNENDYSGSILQENLLSDYCWPDLSSYFQEEV